MRRGKSRNGLLPSSLRIISSCLKTVSANAGNVASTVRSAGVSVAASISALPEDEKDQVLWVGFDSLELGPASFKHVLLLGYNNGFQVLDVEDSSNVCELVSRRDGPVTFLQMQPIPAKSENEGYRSSHPLLLAVAGDEANGSGMVQGGRLSALISEGSSEPHHRNCVTPPTVVRFYSLNSHNYVHVLRFRSAVYLVRCSPRIVAVSLAAQIYCFDAVTLENKFSVLTYPLQGAVGDNIGFGPMAVGPRWLAYASNNPLSSNTGRLSPQNLTPSPGVSPSTSPGSGSLVARYAMESSKQLAAGILNLGDMGYKTLSKYYQEFNSDGSSSPLSSSSTRRSGRILPTAHSCEADNAGMVAVKDFVSKEVISQFRAHASPISALCFDPSGTLLVTASINGHNINVFRIMPTSMSNDTNCTRYDWTASHVHLYKLYRGITSAVIQDICFSHYSQWVAIVSSRGTCHIFLLSPFGGDASLQQQSPYCDGPNLAPNLTLPWWCTESSTIDPQSLQPPPPLTVSVVSRIKSCGSGWLNTVSSVAASAAGKMHVPSGAIAAVFHDSINSIQSALSKENSLEHLLVYSPSGHLIQHALMPCLGTDSCGGSSRNGSGPLLQSQDEELRVSAEAVQWWDVCRRASWPEREQNICRISGSCKATETVLDTSNCHVKRSTFPFPPNHVLSGKDFMRAHEKPHVYLSNAEVQFCSGRIPIWQKSKVCFSVINLSRIEEKTANFLVDGEMEIEKLSCIKVEIKRKDLLPVFKSSHVVHPDSGNGGGSYHATALDTHRVREQLSRDSSVELGSHAVLSSTVLNEVSARRLCEPINMQYAGHSVPDHRTLSSNHFTQHEILEESIVLAPTFLQTDTCAEVQTKYPKIDIISSHSGNSPIDGSIINDFTSLTSSSGCAGKSIRTDNSGSSGDKPSLLFENTEVSCSNNSVEFDTKYFNESYCKISELDDSRELTEAVTDADSSSSHCEREKHEDGDNDDILGGVFTFSEEG
ncbi:Autophagy-related protein 18h [Apostasia shenzhenica]|uniref:Autophagy-related protein 18h n=1 Tax=Apostasia shenzhenica TaxID=1088818 RepID=A0A2I0AZB7_9ASPA|nr:Autophagy-related protein 18h [Apostasia shenzhenica]